MLLQAYFAEERVPEPGIECCPRGAPSSGGASILDVDAVDEPVRFRIEIKEDFLLLWVEFTEVSSLELGFPGTRVLLLTASE